MRPPVIALVAGISGERVTDWLLTHGLRILVIAAAVAALVIALRRLVPGAVDAMMRRRLLGRTEEEAVKRVNTLTLVFVRTGEVVLVVAGLFTALPELGINIAPVLAGVGIVGIAVGFGAQTLVRDTINGLFIIIENQYGIGDMVTVAGIFGRVEDVSLRRTVLRDLDGTVHSIPNSQIGVASNHTREWSGVNMNVTVAYSADLDRATAVIDAVGREMASDAEWGPQIVEAPHVVRVEAFKDSGVALRVMGVTKPVRQWEVMGEMRRRLKKALESEGIELRW